MSFRSSLANGNKSPSDKICQTNTQSSEQTCPTSGVDPGLPIGGVPTLIGGGANLRHRHFLVKTYVKMKEFGPVGGGVHQKLLYVDPPLHMTCNKNPLLSVDYSQNKCIGYYYSSLF